MRLNWVSVWHNMAEKPDITMNLKSNNNIFNNSFFKESAEGSSKIRDSKYENCNSIFVIRDLRFEF